MAGESLRSGVSIFWLSMRRCYEYLGSVLTLSLVWFGLGLLPAFYLFEFARLVPSLLSFVLLALALVLLTAPVTAAVYGGADALIMGEGVSATILWGRFRRHYKPTVQVSAVVLVLMTILVIDVIFFLSSQVRLAQFLAIPCLYLAIFLSMMTVYMLPLVVYQDSVWWRVLHRAALLVLDNIVVTIMLITETLLVLLVGVALVLSVPLLLAGVVSLLHVTALREVLKKYDSPQDKTEVES